ncbi:hypothetical protein, partial [Desulfoprunum benzoelyticum]
HAPSASVIATNPLVHAPSASVISTNPRCHLDQPPLSSRPQGEIFFCQGTTRFLAALRNDGGGGIMDFALSGTSSTVASTNPLVHALQFPSSRPTP